MGSVELSSLIPSMGSGGVFLPYTEHGLGGVWVVALFLLELELCLGGD